jgi:hypothetical protein
VNRAPYLLLSLLLLAGLSTSMAQNLTCARCGRAIEGTYFKVDGRPVCSRECAAALMPRCEACGAQGVRLVQGKDARVLCEKCFESALPSCCLCGRKLTSSIVIEGKVFCEAHARGPRCSNCQLPHLQAFLLPDGRRLCAACRAEAVLDAETARTLYEQARDRVAEVTALRSASLPPLSLADSAELQRESGDAGSRGLYVRKLTIRETQRLVGPPRVETNATERILILVGLPRAEFLATAAHELTHDLAAERFPRVKSEAPRWVEEGICQYVAGMVCRKEGLSGPLQRMATNQDRDYRDGYLRLLEWFGPENWAGLLAWIQRSDLRSPPPRSGAPGAPRIASPTACPRPSRSRRARARG